MSAWLLLTVLAQAPAQVRVVFGGDVIPHEPVKYVARVHDTGQELGDGWGQVFGPLAPVFRRNDLAVVNLESPVLSTERPALGDKVFNAPREMLNGLQRAGVTVASFANNHCLDQGAAGITSTRALLHESGLLGVGADLTEDAAWKPLVVERQGVTVGLIAVTRWLNGNQNPKGHTAPHVPIVPYAGDPIVGARSTTQLIEFVRTEAARVDALIVSIHWGVEYQPRPTEDDRRLAAALIDAGALAVVGHHPHVLQPVEWHTRPDGTVGLVAFSLGNLVSNQDASDAVGTARDGLLLELTVTKDQRGVRLADVSGVPVATENRQGQGRARRVQPVLLDDEVAAIDERLGVLRQRPQVVVRDEQRTLSRRLAVAQARLQRIRALLPAP